MALSPFNSRSPSLTVPSPNSALRLKAAAVQNASGRAMTAKAESNPERELTEQLNDEVRRKYVKGALNTATPFIHSRDFYETDKGNRQETR